MPTTPALDGRVLDQRPLHHLRRDVRAVVDDDLLAPAAEVEVAVVVRAHHVAGVEPPFAKRLGGRPSSQYPTVAEGGRIHTRPSSPLRAPRPRRPGSPLPRPAPPCRPIPPGSHRTAGSRGEPGLGEAVGLVDHEPGQGAELALELGARRSHRRRGRAAARRSRPAAPWSRVRAKSAEGSIESTVGSSHAEAAGARRRRSCGQRSRSAPTLSAAKVT